METDQLEFLFFISHFRFTVLSRGRRAPDREFFLYGNLFFLLIFIIPFIIAVLLQKEAETAKKCELTSEGMNSYSPDECVRANTCGLRCLFFTDTLSNLSFKERSSRPPVSGLLTNLLLRGTRGPSPSWSASSFLSSSFVIFARSFSIRSRSSFFCFSLSIFSRPSRIHAGSVRLFTASEGDTQSENQSNTVILSA